MRPSRLALRTAMIMAGATGMFQFFIMMATNIPVSAVIEPTDRSMPPIRMTKVMPMAMVKLMEICCRIFSRLVCFKKAGDAIAIMTHRTRKASKMPRIFRDLILLLRERFIFIVSFPASDSGAAARSQIHQ